MKPEELKEFEALPFEEALKRLEEVVDKMEDGNLPLDQMIQHYEQGNALSTVCGKKLKALEKKIQVLVKATDEGGEWQDFDASNERQNAGLVNTIVAEEEEPEEEANFSSDDSEDLLF